MFILIEYNSGGIGHARIPQTLGLAYHKWQLRSYVLFSTKHRSVSETCKEKKTFHQKKKQNTVKLTCDLPIATLTSTWIWILTSTSATETNAYCDYGAVTQTDAEN